MSKSVCWTSKRLSFCSKITVSLNGAEPKNVLDFDQQSVTKRRWFESGFLRQKSPSIPKNHGISSHWWFGDPRTEKQSHSHLFFGGSQLRWFLGTWGFFVERRQQWNLHRDPTKTCGRRTWIFTNACDCCVPAMVIKWCFRAAPCYSWAPWKLQQKRVGDELPRSLQGKRFSKTFFCVYLNGESYPKGSEQ